MNRRFSKEEFLRALSEFQMEEPDFRALTLMFGEHKSRQTGRGIEFKDYRPYKDGEDIDLIDREATLRIGLRLVRENLTEEKIRHIVLFDDSRSLCFYGMRETAIMAVGCYLVSCVKGGDPARLVVLKNTDILFDTQPMHTFEDITSFLLDFWDRPSESGKTETSELFSFAMKAARFLSFASTRALLVSDFSFQDVDAGYERSSRGLGSSPKMVLRNQEILRRAVGVIAEDELSSQMAFLGISPDWNEFLGLRGFVPYRDAENGKRSWEHFTRKKARLFVESQKQREKVWFDSARTFNVPMLWIHAASPREIVSQLLQKSEMIGG